MISIAAILCLPLGLCGWSKWHYPRNALPDEVEWTEIIAFGDQSGVRDGCAFGAYRISLETSDRFAKAKVSRDWRRTPAILEDGQYLVLEPEGRRITLYADHATGCASTKAAREQMPQFYGEAMASKDSWYKILNHGETLIVVAPRKRLAWYLNFG